jgi:hypothetical protein
MSIPDSSQECLYLSENILLTYTKIIQSLICTEELNTDSNIHITPAAVPEAHGAIAIDINIYFHICDKTGYTTEGCSVNQNSQKHGYQSSFEDDKIHKDKGLFKCCYCSKPGHIIEECCKHIYEE